MLKERDYFKEFCKLLPTEHGFHPVLGSAPLLRLHGEHLACMEYYANRQDFNRIISQLNEFIPKIKNVRISRVALRQTFHNYSVTEFWESEYCDPDSLRRPAIKDALDQKCWSIFLARLCICEAKELYLRSYKGVINRRLNKLIRGNK